MPTFLHSLGQKRPFAHLIFNRLVNGQALARPSEHSERINHLLGACYASVPNWEN